MEFAFNASSGIGLHPRGHWDRVLPLQTCHLQEPPSVDIALAARAFVRDRGMSCWEPRARVGFLRDLVVRSSRSTGEVMVGIVTGPGPFPEAAAFAERLSAVHPRIVGVLRAIRSGPADGAPLERVEVLTGRATITEEIAGFRFDIGLSTFFQPNAAQAERLVELVLEAAGPLDATARVVDLYCGVGMFTLPLSRRAGSVDGVEMANAAVIAARENAARNGVANVTFHAGDARHVLPDLLADTPGAVRVVVLDPPRDGAGGKVMRRIARAAPERIVYVSCNPATLARDLREIMPFGYRLAVIQPVDLFPQTYHVETVVLAKRGPGDGLRSAGPSALAGDDLPR
jgi:23S rRNA (uracil1939-C5)-methyltransferase